MPGESQQVPAGSPDPTVLTTEQLERAIENLKVLLEAQLHGQEAICDEKFHSVEAKLNLIERQRVEQKEDTKAAVDAALAAAKEAVKEQTTASERSIEKSETATVKSIDQLGEKFDTAVDGLRRELGDVKEKVTAIEQRKVGGQEARTVAQETRSGLTSGAQLAVAAFVAVLLLVSTIATVAALSP